MEKYKWIDKFAVNFDDLDSLVQMKDDFINAEYRNVLNNAQQSPNSSINDFPERY